MRKLTQEMEPVRAYYSAAFFCAVRDSFQPVPPVVPADATNLGQRNNARNRILHRAARARRFIREASMEFTNTTDGFGRIYQVLRYLGSLYIDLDKFLEGMEKEWERIDRDPGHGRYLIDRVIMIGQKLGVQDLEPFDEYAEFAPGPTPGE